MVACIFLLVSVGFSNAAISANGIRAGGPELDGEAVACHLPESQHLKNLPGIDGSGLCVFTAIDLAARWSNEPALIGFRDFMTKFRGGGWPAKVDEFLPKMAASRGRPTPGYLQHTGGDADFLHRALKTGRIVCVTYDGRDGVFYRTRIAHMVNLVHLSETRAAIIDNNYPGRWLWMSPAEFLERWRSLSGGWAIVLLKPGPPPIPVNRPTMIGEMPEPTPADVVANYGLSLRDCPSGTCYRLNVKVVSREAAMAALGSLPDDSDRQRLTIVGDESLRKRVVDDLTNNPLLASLRDKLIVQDYPDDHWAVAGVGFAPGITLQSAPGRDGKAPVLFRFAIYRGPERLAAALRKADPNYQPERDPDPGTPTPDNPKPDPSGPSGIPPSGWAILGGLAGWIAFQRRDER